MQTLWRSLAIVGLVIAAAAGTAWAQRQRGTLGPPGTRATEGIYFRDAFGRCLRLQPQLADDGQLMILVMSNEACAKRERTCVP